MIGIQQRQLQVLPGFLRLARMPAGSAASAVVNHHRPNPRFRRASPAPFTADAIAGLRPGSGGHGHGRRHEATFAHSPML